ncbi:hypothetical protein Tco_0165470, partial [Tanacetum coccineum]
VTPAPASVKAFEESCVTCGGAHYLMDPELVEYTIKVPPPLVQKPLAPLQKIYEMPKRDPLHPNIPYPSMMNKEKQQDKDEIQIHKFWQMFKQLHINISLADWYRIFTKGRKIKQKRTKQSGMEKRGKAKVKSKPKSTKVKKSSQKPTKRSQILKL